MPEQKITLVPDPARTSEGLRDMGYSFETSVADIVDNSIAANATVVDIVVQLDFRGQVTLAIADNGEGMTRVGLVDAMRYGSLERSDPASLGKFGLGLKTASTAWCRRLSVVTRESGRSAPMMATWDLDHMAERRDWELLITDEPDQDAVAYLNQIAPGGAGTVVMWKKVGRLLRNYKNPTGVHAKNALNAHCENLRFHLSMTYQRFLDTRDKRARNVRVNLNRKRIVAWNPFQEGIAELVAESRQGVDNGAEFQARAFVLPRDEEFANVGQKEAARISTDRQGIYIYRENRLIHSADWLGMFQKEPHSNLLRVEFSFDHRLDVALQLDVKKSRILLDGELMKWLREFLSAPRREAVRRYRKGYSAAASKSAKKDVHHASNRAISDKEAQVGGATVTVDNVETGEVTVENEQGVFSLKLPVASAAAPGQVHVEPVDGLDDGILYEPAVIETHKAVRVNTRHPYYLKVYIPNRKDSVTIQGLDSLFWALCVAELSSTNYDANEVFDSMRYEISRILRKLVESLPDPDEADFSGADDAG